MNPRGGIRGAWLLFALVLAALVVGMAGCATTSDNENASERPWNTPKNWEYGFPGMYDQPH